MREIPGSTGHPGVEAIRTDRTHGSAYLSRRALGVLRDQAQRLQEHPPEVAWSVLRELAQALIEAQPAMAVLRNRVNRVMHACREASSAGGVAAEAQGALDDALRREHEATERAAGYMAGRRVLTLSRSGTVLQALLEARPAPAVFIAESRPGGEGVGMAEEVAQAGLEATLLPDAAVAYVLHANLIDVIVVGADSLLPAGHVLNKVGTHGVALAARQAGLPCYVVATTDKVSISAEHVVEGDASEGFYEGDASLGVVAPLFEQTPARLFSGAITEVGMLAMAEIQDLAYELKGLATW